MLNESQKRALALLDTLLKKEEGKRRIKNDLAFLTTAASKPKWDERPDIWASDWCEGWAFRPHYAHAEALGIELTKRSRVIGNYIELREGKLRPVPARDKDGEIKKNKNGEVIPAPMSLWWMLWTQSTAFNFRAGYTIHSYGVEHFDKTWGEQVPHNPVSLQITDAKPAQSGGKETQRNHGEVTFRLHRREDGYAAGETRTMSQDDFVRFLITGREGEATANG